MRWVIIQTMGVRGKWLLEPCKKKNARAAVLGERAVCPTKKRQWGSVGGVEKDLREL
jgi:hypothetical protein